MLCGRGSLVRVGIKLRQRRRRGRGALRVPRGNKNWFAHSFVSIGVVHTSHAHQCPAIPIVLVAHLLFMPFLFEFPRKSIYNVFIRFVFSSCCERIEGRTTVGTDTETDRPVNSLAPFLGFGYYDNPTHTPQGTLPPTTRFATFLAIFKHFCSYACFTSYLFDCPTGGRAGEQGQRSGKGRGVAAGNCQVACAFMFAQQKQPRPNARPVFLQQSHVCLTHK